MIIGLDKIQAYIEENHIEMIDLKFSDLWGRWHHVTIPAATQNLSLLESGVGFDGSSVGLRHVKSGDMALLPDWYTAFQDPFCEVPTLSYICYPVEADSKIRFAGDPREIARRAEAYMRTQGIAQDSRWGPEFEFYVFSSVKIENQPNASGYWFDAVEGEWQRSLPGHGHTIPHHGGYHAIPPNDQLSGLRTRMSMTLQSIGVPVKYHHHEVGGPGQCEIETPMLSLLSACDAVQLVKYVTMNVAHAAGQTVCYLPKPLVGEAGSGMHFHQQLFNGQKNLFYDADGPHQMSRTALYYIGGLLHHAPALLALTNPSTNSYRRLIPGFEAPVNCFFSSGNRSAAIRIPKYATDEQDVRFEFRPPDATCNPYLAVAAMLMAGLDGIMQKIDPTEAGFGPINEDIFQWTEKERAQIQGLPTSLETALAALEVDHQFLLAGDVFSAAMIKDWIDKKAEEVDEVNRRPHPYEIAMYFN